MATENTWKSILQPVATALVAFLAAATFYMQQSGSEKSDAWQARTNQRLEHLEGRSLQRDADLDNLRILIGDVRSDVSYIRGLLENKKK